ncbi:MAG: hypothetical protein JO064_06400 [Actinobacteria bacterium]|nr:hypothetical protein [Actinomycetota bacterium]
MKVKIRLGALALALAAFGLVWSLPALAHGTARKATVINVVAGKPSEFKFQLSKASAPAGSVTFVVTNQGALKHDFNIGGKTTPQLAKGKSAKLTVTLKKGSFTYKCTVPGHAAAGMKGTFKAT